MHAHDEAVLRELAGHEAARLRDGTLPWRWWLERAARLGRRYGFTDTLLISAQWRAATDVRSYGSWLAAGRQVRRGEKGIAILPEAPGGGPRTVFDISQTDGLPPEVPRARGPREARERLAALAARRGVPPVQEVDDLRACTVLAHRLAHAFEPGDHADRGGCHGLRRVEADSVAFLVLAHFGLDTGGLAFPDRVAAGPDFADRILRTARRVCAAQKFSDAHDLMDAAHAFFRARMPDGWVPGYLSGRGFGRDVQRRWQIGYAPPGPRALTRHLRARGHDDAAIVAAGLARRGRTGRLYDTFRDRAMFAIRSPADGTIAGFIGRLPDGAPGPKYLNGPDTAAFHKSELLFGLHEMRDRLAGGRARPIMVEGPLDAIAVNVASREHAAVATLGLSLTAAQLAALDEIAGLDRSGLVVALDGDGAGRSATLRLWRALKGVGGPLEAALFPDGRDPADVLRGEGRRGVRDVLGSPVPLMDVVVDGAIERSGGSLATPEERLAAIRAAVAVIAGGRAGEAARQVVRVAARARVPCVTVTAELTAAVTHSG
ncbi:hypothetical protein Acsp03_23270 [Actinomadura sp. NBRC 104412]|uniref:toprim domain-containing protein n=1 Tax=Actinomadura sp. NBRC 104412 TaxID=3032203 RepID=UPI0024A2A348|nr:toprim domain-containing protein [Actinomadura sp. NBRC 104412]GLZ04861.1 hypothetical protein Acsp03_23270 [Actinomadura sp. NBRC 104412]